MNEQDKEGPFECYLHVTESASGEEWNQEIKGNMTLDLRTRVKHFLKTEFGGEVALDGNITRLIDGKYYANIITDWRLPDSFVVWDGGGFYTKSTYE